MSSKGHLLAGGHSAGIFSDMTIDGPVIGTLVAVVDRAKNLPNRKTIGKQDPYCAARLGKEAKKTKTDIRGGQTPKWDQELRFKVHDSPDYNQLKVSVFSDDKKTDLIGETWVDLRAIIVSGGGQSDQWHQLSCRNKYAGEIRMEITYYDSRPKPEKPVPVSAPIQTPAVPTGSARGRNGMNSLDGTSPSPSTGSTFGPRGPAPKRRPLPSDPVSGQAPAQPPAQVPVAAPVQPPLPLPGPEVTQTPLRPQPNPPVAYSTPTKPPLAPASYSNTASQQVLYPQQQIAPSHVSRARHQIYQDQDPFATATEVGYDDAPLGANHHVRHETHQSHHSRSQHSQHSHSSHTHDRSQYGTRELTPDYVEFQEQQQPATAPTAPPSFYEDPNLPALIEDRPPPPPAHRSRNNSNGGYATDAALRSSLDSSPQKGTTPVTMRHDVLRNEAHRHSVSNVYPGRPTYRPLDSSPTKSTLPSNAMYGAEPPHQISPPRHSSYDAGHDPQGRYRDSYGDSVEASSPAPLHLSRSGLSASPAPLYALNGPSQSRSGESTGFTDGYPDRQSPSPMASHVFDRESPGPSSGSGRRSYGAYDAQEDAYQTMGPEQADDGRVSQASESYMLPPVPSSLVPGVDVSLALELRSRVHQGERQGDRQQQQYQEPEMRYALPAQSTASVPVQATPPRGRQLTGYGQESSSQPYTPQRSQTQVYSTPPQPPSQPHQQPPSIPRYDRSPGQYSPAAPSPIAQVGSRGNSPNPRHTIKRKSVSPAPAPPPPPMLEDEPEMPFGPDSFDSLNPALTNSMDQPVRPDYDEARGKIIAHDGREIDPSDHLPMETWAPEPEPKPPKSEPTSATASPLDYGTQTSGRKQLRIAGRPQSSVGSSGITFSSADDPKTTYTPTARNRLQKKVARHSTMGTLTAGDALQTQGSPLAPLTHPRQQHQDSNYTPPRVLTRASTFDYASENDGGVGVGGAPPLPAKLPVGSMGAGSCRNSYDGGGRYRASIGGLYPDDRGDRSPVMSGALPSTSPALSGGSGGGGSSGGGSARALPWNGSSSVGSGVAPPMGEISLVEEMRRIDIGTGRARRHQGGSAYY